VKIQVFWAFDWLSSSSGSKVHFYTGCYFIINILKENFLKLSSAVGLSTC